ncbi:MAG: ABC transporter ATP-binding protein [Candidatus Saccharimonadales bacterium]
MKNIIKVDHLTKTYNGTKVVNDISFAVEKGEIFGILGPNGAGKSTTLEMMETLRPIDDGSVTIDGLDVAKNPRKIKQIIGVQLQSSAFLQKLTLEDQLKLFAKIYGEKNINIDKKLAEFDLVTKRKSFVESLSGGQKQRFSIAVALINTPKVLFLDEPTTGLDPQARRNLWELIKSIKKRGITIILTTHYMDEAELLCDRLAIMDGGKILTINTPKKLIKELLGRGFEKEQIEEKANLEDVFIDLTGKDLRES